MKLHKDSDPISSHKSINTNQSVLMCLAKENLRNFGIVLPSIYRGAWPRTEDLPILKSLKVKAVMTLYSSDYEEENKRLKVLKGLLKNNKFQHLLVDINSVDSYFYSANKLLELREEAYLHCSAGANRTGIVSLLAYLYFAKNNGKPPMNKDEIVRLLKRAADFGFDFHKPERKIVMDEVLQKAANYGLISTQVFSNPSKQ